MTAGMTLDIHCAWDTGNMSGMGVDMNRQRRCSAAQTHWTYAETVNSSEKIILLIREQRVGIFSPELPKKRLFSDQSSFFESAP